jgi:hypothetical protein
MMAAAEAAGEHGVHRGRRFYDELSCGGVCGGSLRRLRGPVGCAACEEPGAKRKGGFVLQVSRTSPRWACSRAWCASACMWYGCGPEPWWFLGLASASLFLPAWCLAWHGGWLRPTVMHLVGC